MMCRDNIKPHPFLTKNGPKIPERVPDQVTIQKLERAIRRLEFALEEYQRNALPTSSIDFNLSQAIYLIDSIRKDINLQ